eukprot:5809967-Prymnesium_polylepis.1
MGRSAQLFSHAVLKVSSAFLTSATLRLAIAEGTQQAAGEVLREECLIAIAQHQLRKVKRHAEDLHRRPIILRRQVDCGEEGMRIGREHKSALLFLRLAV